MALGSTQPLVKMSTRKISWGWRRLVREADDLTTLMCWMSWKSVSLNLLEPSGPLRACYRTPLPFLLVIDEHPQNVLSQISCWLHPSYVKNIFISIWFYQALAESLSKFIAPKSTGRHFFVLYVLMLGYLEKRITADSKLSNDHTFWLGQWQLGRIQV